MVVHFPLLVLIFGFHASLIKIGTKERKKKENTIDQHHHKILNLTMLPSLLLPPSSFHAALTTTTLAVALLSSWFLASLVEGHGYMFEPPSRSYSAWQTGLDYGAEAGVPNRDNCAWCININDGVCGITQSGINYDAWLDSTGQPMPWQSQATYTEGDIITVSSILTAHHEGHLEVWACPQGRASTQDCFREHKLDFVDDVSFGMPQDPNYPLRGVRVPSSSSLSFLFCSLRIRLWI